MAAKKKTATKEAPVQTEKEVEIKETVKAEKAAVKKPAAKRTAKKALKTSLYVQAGGKEVSMEEAVARVKNAWVVTGNKEADLKEIAVYVKPEEGSIYYVANGDITGRVDF